MIRAREFSVFTAVGTTAAGVQVGIVAGAVPHGLSPLLANSLGFLIAFVVGFVGHARWSFPAVGRPVGPALGRFAAVSVVGFAANEVCYAGTLLFTSLDYRVALVAVIASLGLAKLLASKHWVFADP